MANEKSAFGMATKSRCLKLCEGFKCSLPPRTNRSPKHCALFATRVKSVFGRKRAETAAGFATVGDLGVLPVLLGGLFFGVEGCRFMVFFIFGNFFDDGFFVGFVDDCLFFL